MANFPVVGGGPVGAGSVGLFQGDNGAAPSLNVAVNESFTLADTQTATAVRSGAQAESFTLADTQTATLTRVGAQAETFTLADTQVAQAVFSSAQAETFTLVDTQTGDVVGGAADQVTESFTLADTQAATLTREGAQAESFTLVDTQVSQGVFNSAQAESFTLVDTQVSQGVFNSAQAETFTLVDTQTGELLNLNVQVDESFTLSDSCTGTVVSPIQNPTVTGADEWPRKKGHRKEVAEDLLEVIGELADTPLEAKKAIAVVKAQRKDLPPPVHLDTESLSEARALVKQAVAVVQSRARRRQDEELLLF